MVTYIRVYVRVTAVFLLGVAVGWLLSRRKAEPNARDAAAWAYLDRISRAGTWTSADGTTTVTWT